MEDPITAWAKILGGSGSIALLAFLGKKFLYPLVASRTKNIVSENDANAKGNDAYIKQVEHLTEEIKRLHDRIRSKDEEMTKTEEAFRTRLGTRTKEKDEEIQRLEELYKGVVAQVRQVRQHQTLDETALSIENEALRKKLREVEIELEVTRRELENLKKRIVQAETQAGKDFENPISSD
jgi:chromosome segregation ATPase